MVHGLWYMLVLQGWCMVMGTWYRYMIHGDGMLVHIGAWLVDGLVMFESG
jgi:hypothetical protein